ncbi:hypothetical protein UA08_08205 [Talaromyces atroroseus]|uniref:HhH-GPD domain-containing protein n=1 Tax=Talaromyces atroroseus TaxID=1441469 RepID=A0A225AHE6_TALAT|nr:hypothetical protein UA08_08205 [Talaromyces atroroseus]OKL56468.1 hypothetical protein UA08_08205 [Talaromyces atroroseus]
MPSRSTQSTTKKTAKTSRYFTRQTKKTSPKSDTGLHLNLNLNVRSEDGVKTYADETGAGQEEGEIDSDDLAKGRGSIDVHHTSTSFSVEDLQHATGRVIKGVQGGEHDAVPAVQASLETCDAQDGISRHDMNTRARRPNTEPPTSPQKEQQKKQKPQKPKHSSPRKQPPKLSPYFPKPLPLIEASCLPFPPISAPSFGLIQEQLASSPFKLLIATIFLNRTRGPVAIPVLFKLFAQYPTIPKMACANHEDIVNIIRGLGFQNQRATKFIAIAQTWLKCPPAKGRRYRKLNYPCKRDGANVGPDEVVSDEDEGEGDQRVAWEIAHLPGVGAYAIDSWRIFCRDRLRYSSCYDEGGREEGNMSTSSSNVYEPEWKRVLPQDKELRAYLSWMWLKEGWVWNCENGQRTKANSEMMQRAEKGGVAFEGVDGHLVLMNMMTAKEEEEEEEEEEEGKGWIKRAGFSLDCS